MTTPAQVPAGWPGHSTGFPGDPFSYPIVLSSSVQEPSNTESKYLIFLPFCRTGCQASNTGDAPFRKPAQSFIENGNKERMIQKQEIGHCSGISWDRVNFFSAAGTVLCFGFQMLMVLITHCLFGFCHVIFILSRRFTFFSIIIT